MVAKKPKNNGLVLFHGLTIFGSGFGTGLASVHLAVAAQVGYDRKISAATFDLASKGLLASVAVHVRLERAWAGKALVAHLALVLLLRARGNFGAELSHHGMRSRRNSSIDEVTRTR